MIIMIFILHVCPDKMPLLAGGNEVLSFFIILSGFVLGLSNTKYTFSVNGVSWYLSATVFFYIIFIP